MDALAHLHTHTAALLTQVDDTLARWGAPAEHELWPLLRRTGALPGDAVAGLAAWTGSPWRDGAATWRALAAAAGGVRDGLRRLPAWEGRAGDAFGDRAARAHRDAASWADRMLAESAHLEELARCLADGRSRVARALARVAGSVEAVALITGTSPAVASAAGSFAGAAAPVGGHEPGWEPTARARAAADIAVVLLTEVDRLAAELDELLARGPREAGQTVVAADVRSTATTVRVEL